MHAIRTVCQILSMFAFCAVSTLLTSSIAQANSDLKEISQLSSQGQQAVALDRINAYINANPKDVKALFTRGVILAEQNKIEDAIKAFTEITEKHPNLPEPYNNLAVLYAGQGQYDKARKALETAIKTHPSYATAHENLGDIYARMASEAYDKALQLDNGNTRAQGKLALIKDLFSTAGTVKTGDAIKSGGSKTVETGKATQPSETVKPAEQPIRVQEPAQTKAMEQIKPTEPVKAEPEKPQPSTAMDDSKGIETAVHQWARAWSNKNVEQYLDSYASDFQTPKGESRKEWEKTRRERINKPGSITVEINNLHIEQESANRAKVRFKQSYRARNLSQRTLKTLSLRKTEGKWLILQEETDH